MLVTFQKRALILALTACLLLLSACTSKPDHETISSGVSTSSIISSSVTSSQSHIISQTPSSKAESLAQIEEEWGHTGNTPTEYEIYPGTRDPWLWPFSRDSIWNMPIGSDAEYVSANLQPSYFFGVDHERHIKLKASDPIREVRAPSQWNKRWPGTGLQRKMPVPDNLIIPDAQGQSTPNECSAFLMPDGRTIKQLEPTCRVEYGKHIVGYLYDDVDIYSQGIGGTHYGSGLSAIGGSIRKGELTSDEPIRHALKINVWGEKYLYYGTEALGYRWPADRADSYAPMTYGGSNPKLVMGSLLALPRNLKPSDLGIQTEPAKKIFYALQDYGAYISDDSAWDSYDIPAELGVTDEVKEKYGYSMTGSSGPFVSDMQKIIPKLMIIDNNAAGSVGGGGKPCRPLAPNLPKI